MDGGAEGRTRLCSRCHNLIPLKANKDVSRTLRERLEPHPASASQSTRHAAIPVRPCRSHCIVGELGILITRPGAHAARSQHGAQINHVE